MNAHDFPFACYCGFRTSARLRKALYEAGQGAVYVFDGNEAIIFAEVSRTPLPLWPREHPNAKAE